MIAAMKPFRQLGQHRPYPAGDSTTLNPNSPEPSTSSNAILPAFQQQESISDAPDHGTPKRRIFHYWRAEILIYVLATGLLLGILVVFIRVHDQTVSSWTLSIELNTLVAILGTVLRTCLVIVLEEVISQAKWWWFRKPQPLIHIQTYDQASRGIVGSLKLLKTLKVGFEGDFLSAMAALTMILSLSVGPFAQQTITTTHCTRQGKPSSIRKTNFLPPLVEDRPWVDSDGELFLRQVTTNIKALMTNTMVADKVENNLTLFDCPTEECYFDDDALGNSSYSTAGFCAECFDPTNLAKYKEAPTAFSFTNVTVGPVTMALITGSASTSSILGSNVSTLEFAESIAPPHLLETSRYSVANATVLVSASNLPCDAACRLNIPNDRNRNWPLHGGPFIAATCTLYPCIKHLKSHVKNNVLVEDITSTQPMISGIYKEASKFYYAISSPCVAKSGKHYKFEDLDSFANYHGWNKSTFGERGPDSALLDNSDVGHCYFGFGLVYQTSLAQWIKRYFLVESCDLTKYTSSLEEKGGCENWWLNSLQDLNGPPLTFRFLQSKFDNLATAMTNHFRTFKDDSSQNLTALPDTKKGISYHQTTCFNFNWQWLLWPALLYLVTGISLMWTILENKIDRRQAPWKSSVLPLLLFGFKHSLGSEEAQMAGYTKAPRGEDPKTIDRFSENLVVQLRHNDSTGRSAFIQTETHGGEEDPVYHNTPKRSS